MHGIGLHIVEARVVLDLGNLISKLILLIQHLIDETRQVVRRRENAIAKRRLVENRSMWGLDLKDCCGDVWVDICARAVT